MQNKALVPFLGAIAIPIILIAFIVMVVYVPKQMVKPGYNFVYSDNRSSLQKSYKITDNRYVPDPSPSPSSSSYYYPDKDNFYLYDVKTDTSRALDEDTLKNLKLDPNPVSPDGYRILTEMGQSYGLFSVFFGGSERGVFIKNDKAKKKLEGMPSFYYDMQHVAWILP